MCTVTYIPTGNGVYLTSNRDEHNTRGLALPPQQYSRNGCEIVYPKDHDAGGTWIALKDKRDAAVLLNGAFVKHTHIPPYRKSRGVVLLELLETADPINAFQASDLRHIEPFTLILFCNNKLAECRWDGDKKYLEQLDASKPYIWSSVTLYDKDTIAQREGWFRSWLVENDAMSIDSVMNFHQHTGNGDLRNDLVMNRDNALYTVSITSIFIGQSTSSIRYRDLKNPTDFQKTFTYLKKDKTSESRLSGLYWFAKRLHIRLYNWEYWPSFMIYAPLYFYWAWLSLKARSFFFFSAANPSIHYSGFAQECKSDIYDLIPEGYYPKTLLCGSNRDSVQLAGSLEDNGITFPVIAKPNIGERGVQVKLLKTFTELEEYSKRSKVDFLVQEFIPYPHEAGIFYYRIPGTPNGHISGIVSKEFLTVTGDGSSSIEMLLKREQRFVLQLPALKFTYGDLLQKILPAGEQYTLVPYGNHSRGAKFTDISHKITEELTETIDAVCRQIPDFYYGRLDIKFRSWEELEKGISFSIIELNGAGSEPTHIYDPNHSLLYAWKEICRHWQLLYLISSINARQKRIPLMTIADGMKMRRERNKHLKMIAQV